MSIGLARRLAGLALCCAAAAAGCHDVGREAAREPTCITCHEEERQRAAFPLHTAEGFPTDCAQCHNQVQWTPATFDHRVFPLTGAHSVTACASCHSTEPVPKTCVGCHEADRGRSQAVEHLADGFPTACENCHNNLSWIPAAFEHDKLPFVGGHADVPCVQCHSDPGNPAQERGKVCVDCHDADRRTVTNPDHTVAGYPTDCAQCHTVMSWREANFAHDTFRLTGKHSTAACNDCHAQDPVPTTCIGCHDADRKTPKAPQPDHLAATYPTACQNCHSTGGWKPAAFDHSKFPLSGGHSAVACTDCHTDAQNPSVPKGKACYDCHAAEAQQKTTLPDHNVAGFPTDCTACHSTIAWKPATFVHDKFPLAGGHQGIACAGCHSKEPVPTTCVGCHNDDRQKPKPPQPDHLAATFSTRCDTCHNTNAWKPAALDHSKFPLTGGHSVVDCAQCHTDPQNPNAVKGTSCYACHAADRSKAVAPAPDHLQTGFPTACENCHNTTSWLGATIDHSKFPLTGKHTTATCGQCHGYSPVPTTCLGCHAADRNTPRSPQPDHSTATYATCENCHATSGWIPASFNHDKFPLTGGHSGVACTSCHTDAQNPSVPKGKTCNDCHASDATGALFPPHGGLTNCSQCHTVNAWKPSTFDHNQYYRLDSRHRSLACTSCHVDTQSAQSFSCTTGCHRDAHHQSEDCTRCH